MIGRSPGLRDALAAARRVGSTRHAVLILGESGTGKERLAQLVHESSGRSGRFIPVNVATMVESLMDSELFGHERGAFTGASQTKKGLFEAAEGGTLFLDEIGDLPAGLQARLLRVLQEGAIRRVGGTSDIRIDVRIVSATHHNLSEMTARQTFRLDLFHRLAGYQIRLPPLRERGRDVLLLAEQLLTEQAGPRPLRLSQDAQERLLHHAWPGNIRELQNVINQATLDATGPRITARHLILSPSVPANGGQADLDEAIVNFVERHGQVEGVQIQRAFALSKSTAQRRLNRLLEDHRLTTTGVGRGTRYAVPVPCAETDGLDARSRKILEITHQEGEVTRRGVVDRLGISPKTASRVLTGLVETRLLIPLGSGRASRYVLPPP